MSNSKSSLFVFLFTTLVFAATANAQNASTYVAVNSGSDANSCTATSQCQTIAKAVSVTDPKGKVVLTQNGVYDSATIDRPLLVTAAEGINATITNITPGGAGLNTSNLFVTDIVTIRNIHFTGYGGSYGVLSGAGYLNIDNCTFNGFSVGIWITGGRGLFVHNSTFRDNFRGIFIQPAANAETIQVMVESSIFELNNTGFESVEKVRSVIGTTVFSGNAFRGIQVTSPIGAGYKGEITLDNCQLSQNLVGMFVRVTGRGDQIARLSRSTITNNFQAGIQMTAATTVYTLGNNVITGNLTDISGGVLTPLAAM
jgi:hypothetical protein